MKLKLTCKATLPWPVTGHDSHYFRCELPRFHRGYHTGQGFAWTKKKVTSTWKGNKPIWT